MFEYINLITQQVQQYSSIYGNLWYLLVIGFRAMMAISLGMQTYGSEKGDFKCNTADFHCTPMCFDQYGNMTHLRFWVFEIMAVVAPNFIFHFYVSHVTKQIEKMKEEEKEKATLTRRREHQLKLRKFQKREKNVGKVQMKEVFVGRQSVKIIKTPKIMAVLMFSLIIRAVVEACFIRIGYNIFNIQNTASPGSGSNYLWMDVPKVYECRVPKDDTTGLRKACKSHLDMNFIVCWIGRPTEKTYYLRIMNILDFICLLLTLAEIFIIMKRLITLKARKEKKNKYLAMNEYQTPPPGDVSLAMRSPSGSQRRLPAEPQLIRLDSIAFTSGPPKAREARKSRMSDDHDEEKSL